MQELKFQKINRKLFCYFLKFKISEYIFKYNNHTEIYEHGNHESLEMNERQV